MRDAVRKPWEAAVPVAQANRRRASGSLDDVPHRLRLPSYPADRLHDLYGSLSTLLGISMSDAATFIERLPKAELRAPQPAPDRV